MMLVCAFQHVNRLLALAALAARAGGLVQRLYAACC
jgi:hypothetical protein